MAHINNRQNAARNDSRTGGAARRGRGRGRGRREQENREQTCVGCNLPIGREPQHMCTCCRDLSHYIIYGNIPASQKIIDQLSTKFDIKVTYDCTIEEHTGYCTTHENDTYRKVLKVERYPLIYGLFDNDDIDDDGNIINTRTNKMCYYRRVNDACTQGTGSCGLSTFYRLKSAYITKKEPTIDLNEEIRTRQLI